MKRCLSLRSTLASWIAGIALLLLAAPAAFGAPITYVFSGPASGTLGATPFTNAQVTVTGTADTANVSNVDPTTPCINLTGVTIVIAGVGSTTTTGQNLAFSNQTNAVWGFENGTCTSAAGDWLDVTNPQAATYGLVTSIGPTTGTQDFASSTATAAGTLTLTAVPLTFQATLGLSAAVPTLSQWTLLLLGLMLAAMAYFLRGRMRANR